LISNKFFGIKQESLPFRAQSYFIVYPGLRSLFQSSLLPGLEQAAFSMLYVGLLQLSLPWQGTCYLSQPVFEPRLVYVKFLFCTESKGVGAYPCRDLNRQLMRTIIGGNYIVFAVPIHIDRIDQLPIKKYLQRCFTGS